MYKIYAEPKDGAEGLPHYEESVYETQVDAEAAIAEQTEDGITKYWRLSVREQ